MPKCFNVDLQNFKCIFIENSYFIGGLFNDISTFSGYLMPNLSFLEEQ